jgi:regulator of protease activity HflC (stomatin/prohibitin superfamily)
MGDIALAIFEFFKVTLYWFLPWTVLDEYERGVLLRLGRPVARKGSEVIGPGLIFHFPFNIDQLLFTNVVFETGSAELQCQTRDDITINIEVVAGYSISNPRKFLIEVEEAGDAVLDAIGGGVFESVRKRTWEQIDDSDFVDILRSEIGQRGRRFGVKIETVYIHSLTRLGLRYGVLKTVNTSG